MSAIDRETRELLAELAKRAREARAAIDVLHASISDGSKADQFPTVRSDGLQTTQLRPCACRTFTYTVRYESE